jgi:predicted DNA-binding mobile mystery protein A
MSVKDIVIKQYRNKVDQAGKRLEGFSVPPEGWIKTVRKALGMTGTQLAARAGVTKGRISTLEKAELDGGVSLRTMTDIASSMNCRFIYAVVANEDIESVVRKRALEIARKEVKDAGVHMALENQSLSHDQIEAEIQSLTNELIHKKPRLIWNKE